MTDRDQATAPGPTVASGSRVVLIVSSGPSPAPTGATVSMPSVLGKQQGVALQQLQDAGLNTQVFSDFNEAVRRGHIADQFPVPGAGVAIASEVAVLVSYGPAEKTTPVELPDVIGLLEAEAIARMRAAQLEPEVAHDYHPNVAPGVVLAQLPSQATANAEALPQRSPAWLWLGMLLVLLLAVAGVVALTLPLGGKIATVPNVTGQLQPQALQAIGSAGLKVGAVTLQAGSDAAENTVILQSPAAGTKVRSGTAVVLTIAGATTKASVPNVVGLSASNAGSKVEAAGLVAQTESEYSDAVPRGTVVSQSPAAGQSAAPGSAVTVTLSLGPQSTYATLPNLVGMVQTDAADKAVSLGMTSKSANVYSSTAAPNTVAEQVPAAGQSVILGNPVGLSISQGTALSNAVVVPDLSGRSSGSASAALTSSNLNATVVQWDGTGQTADTVVGQAPGAGEQVAPNGTVLVFVSSGK